MAVFLNDTFTGSPGTALEVYNPAWVPLVGVAGSSAISAEGIRARATGTSVYYRNDAQAATGDYSVSADIYALANAGHAGPCGRVSSGANTLYQARYLSGTGIQLLRYIAGAVSTLGTMAFTLNAGETVNLRLEMMGSSIKVYVNGNVTAAISATDAAIPGPGYVGIRFQNVGAAQLQIDNLVGDAAGGTPAITGTFSTTADSGAMAAVGMVGNAVQGSLTAIGDNGAMLSAGIVLNRGAFASSGNDGLMYATGSIAMPVSGAFAAQGQDGTFTASGYNGIPPELVGTIVRRRIRPRVYSKGPQQ